MTQPTDDDPTVVEEVPPPLVGVLTAEAALMIGNAIAAGLSISGLAAALLRWTNLSEEAVDEMLYRAQMAPEWTTAALGSLYQLVSSLGSDAERITAATNLYRRGLYVANAVRRMEQAHPTATAAAKVAAGELDFETAEQLAKEAQGRQELRYADAHLDASAKRMEAAQQVNDAMVEYGSVLGWHAILDERTDALCRDLHGTNFSALRPPHGHWPGSVHPHCRCYAGAPFPTPVTSYTVLVPEGSKSFAATYEGA